MATKLLNPPVREYVYRGDRHTAPELKNRRCTAVFSQKGTCIRGRNGNMLVQFSTGEQHVVIARLLLKVS